jgi:hypothetical protein
VELSGPEAKALSASKNVHTALVVAAVPLFVFIGSTTQFLFFAYYQWSIIPVLAADGPTVAVKRWTLLLLPFAPFWLGGLADARRPTAGATAKMACRAAGEALVGLFVFHELGGLLLSWTFVLTGTTESDQNLDQT